MILIQCYYLVLYNLEQKQKLKIKTKMKERERERERRRERESLENSILFSSKDNFFNNLSESIKTVQPNFEKPGGPNSPTNKKIFLNNFEYNQVDKQVEYFDQHMGAWHPMWCFASKVNV